MDAHARAADTRRVADAQSTERTPHPRDVTQADDSADRRSPRALDGARENRTVVLVNAARKALALGNHEQRCRRARRGEVREELAKRAVVRVRRAASRTGVILDVRLTGHHRRLRCKCAVGSRNQRRCRHLRDGDPDEKEAAKE